MKENPWPEKPHCSIDWIMHELFIRGHDPRRQLGSASTGYWLKPKMPLLLLPGSLKTRDTLEKAGRSARKAWSNYASQCVWSLLWILEPNRHARGTEGYTSSDSAYKAPRTGDRTGLEVQIKPTSPRLQRLAPFAPWSGQDFENCLVLTKAQGKCTTDHITPAGPWFHYPEHLENISNNTLIGAVNDETGEVNCVKDHLENENGDSPGTACYYTAQNREWVTTTTEKAHLVEHAALRPRYLGGAAIIAKSFARIHEANLKKQGILALKFTNEADYDKIQCSDLISLRGLTSLTPGKNIILAVTPTEGGYETWQTQLGHTFTHEQNEYFVTGSALNLMAEKSLSNLRHETSYIVPKNCFFAIYSSLPNMVAFSVKSMEFFVFFRRYATLHFADTESGLFHIDRFKC
ncbi:Aconitate hydratase [Talaromyces pinophilus]|nr:Aconitate hydratase [Talaromyces pinophilus]